MPVRLGIRYRLLIPLGLLLIGVVGASAWSARLAARRAEERVVGQVRNIAHTLESARFAITPTILEQMKDLSGAEFVLVQPDGSRFDTFGRADVGLPPGEALGRPGDGIGPAVEVQGRAYRGWRLTLRGPTPNADATVYLFYPESLLEEAIADAQRPTLLGLVFALLAIGLTFGIGQRIVGRIRSLERRTRMIAAGDFSPMPLPRANDELRDLTASVNDMADRLARLQGAVQTTERLRLSGQLAAGLAHQLRNGVTGAKLAIELYVDAHPGRDAEALDVALRQLALMEANLRRFIDLGRPTAADRRVCSMSQVLSDVVELYRPRYKHAGIELGWEPPAEDVFIDGDPDQLGDLFGNLIGNAADAVGAGGDVQVTLTRAGRSAVVEVSDTGPGPSPDVASRLFEPFVSGKPDGIGLGLAVARHAAEAHGGRVVWRRDGARTVFRVDLPLRRPG